jgi:biofilm PGA synthesis protein PgaD
MREDALHAESLPLILNMPHLVSPLTKFVSTAVTVLFWCFFLYLWAPLLILLAGLIGFHSASETIYIDEAGEFTRLTLSYFLVVFLLGGALLMWALQEYLRFRNVNRRRRPAPAEVSDLAAYLDIEEGVLAEWQQTRRMVAHHDKTGNVLRFSNVLS